MGVERLTVTAGEEASYAEEEISYAEGSFDSISNLSSVDTTLPMGANAAHGRDESDAAHGRGRSPRARMEGRCPRARTQPTGAYSCMSE